MGDFVGQDEVSFLEGITAFLFQVLTGYPLFLSLIFYKLHTLVLNCQT